MHPEFHLHAYYIIVGYNYITNSPMHSMISYWPEKLGCHGNMTFAPGLHESTSSTQVT